MPDIASDTTVASCYPPESLYSTWQEHAEHLDMSLSQFIIRMVEAGRKQVDIDEATSESIRELRQNYTDLKYELERQRERNKELERQLHRTAHSEVVTYIEDNPGARTPEIIQYIADTVPGRVASHLDVLEGDVIEQRDTKYYPLESDN